jgi:hypothetical protein
MRAHKTANNELDPSRFSVLPSRRERSESSDCAPLESGRKARQTMFFVDEQELFQGR